VDYFEEMGYAKLLMALYKRAKDKGISISNNND